MRDYKVTGVQTCALPIWAAMPTFVVRAIDDEGAADPTPARQAFLFRNDPPTIELVGIPVLPATRSEERRVGTEGRAGWSPAQGDTARSRPRGWQGGSAVR